MLTGAKCGKLPTFAISVYSGDNHLWFVIFLDIKTLYSQPHDVSAINIFFLKEITVLEFTNSFYAVLANFGHLS